MFFHPWVPPAFDLLFGATYVALAALVTVDVLLKKSDVRSALGWIAAAWLSPVLGAVIYYLFGVNRVSRRALKLRRPGAVAGPQKDGKPPSLPDANMALLNASSGRITGNPLCGGNAITVLEGGDATYPAMLAAIRGAKRSIAFATYIFRDDEAGHAFAEALAEAKDRGVEVRVLLDSVGTGYVFARIYRRLRRRGVTVARFLHTWIPWRMPFLNMRNHRKLLVTDGQTAFIGGINIANGHSRKLAKKHRAPVIDDVHFQVEGPAVTLIMDTFARDWEFTTGEELDAKRWWSALSHAGGIAARDVPSGPDNDIYKIEMILGAALALAKKSVRIVTPYFMPDQRLQFAIAQAGLRGVTVDVVLPRVSDQRFMDWAMRGNLRFFNHISANIYLTPPPFDHAKLAVVDDEWCLIGSSNWDARSLRLNFEFDLECYDKEFAAQLNALIDIRIARGRKVNHAHLARENILIRLRNAAARLMMPYL